MTSKRIYPVTFRIHLLISIFTITFGSENKTSKIGLSQRTKQNIYPEPWDQNRFFSSSLEVSQPKYNPGIFQPMNNPIITRPMHYPEIVQPIYTPKVFQPKYTPEVGQPRTFNEQMQRKILGVMMGTAAERTLHQMHLANPGILNSLTGKIIPLAGNAANKPPPGRRTLFAPIIHNTIVNENKNENKNKNKNENKNGPNIMPYLLPADPNFPLLTHLLESVIKNSNIGQEHSGHKPLRICFEL